MKKAGKFLVVVFFTGLLLTLLLLFLFRDSSNTPITLSDGSVVYFRHVTFGTNHVFNPSLTSIVKLLPTDIQSSLEKKFPGHINKTTQKTSDPSVAVWLERRSNTNSVPNRTGRNYDIYITGLGMEPSGSAVSPYKWNSTQGNYVAPLVFESWPRRSEWLVCVIYEPSSGMKHVEAGRFRFRNPFVVDAPSWVPEPLPVTKSAGDIEVTLVNFASGVERRPSISRDDESMMESYRSAEDGETPNAAVQIQINSPRGTNEAWRVSEYYLSDAAGNDKKASFWSGTIHQRIGHFGPVLWPDEKAWKLTLYLKREEGVPPEDRLIFENLNTSVGEGAGTNYVTQQMHGYEFSMKETVYWSGNPNSYNTQGLRLEHSELDQNTAVDLLSVVSDVDSKILETTGASWSNDSYETGLRDLSTNATTLTLTYAVQKTRKVEFLVAPNWIDKTNEIEFITERQ